MIKNLYSQARHSKNCWRSFPFNRSSVTLNCLTTVQPQLSMRSINACCATTSHFLLFAALIACRVSARDASSYRLKRTRLVQAQTVEKISGPLAKYQLDSLKKWQLFDYVAQTVFKNLTIVTRSLIKRNVRAQKLVVLPVVGLSKYFVQLNNLNFI